MLDPQFDEYENKGFLLDGKYQYISPIQEGSFGKVTLAYNTATRCEVAMKAMYKNQPETRKMAQHEIRMLTRLGPANDNICQLLDHFETAEYVVLVLEYCSNGDLYDLIHSGLSISAVDLWHIAKELSSGVQYAHSLGIYHRDIKPENVLFNSFGRVKLCDWGLSTTARHSAQFNVGTEKYMAPECLRREDDDEQCERSERSEHHHQGADGTYDTKYADYWSLGITLFTAVFGTSPFKPVAGSTKASLEHDTNFKNFVYFGKSEVLYDIYPTMNKNCFDIFMHLLKTGGKDDEENTSKKISARNLDMFLHDLESNWKFGLTIDEEYELEQLEDDDEYEYGGALHRAGGQHKESNDLFDMDHDDLGSGDSKQDSLTDPTAYDDDDSELDELEDFIGLAAPHSIKIPAARAAGGIGGGVSGVSGAVMDVTSTHSATTTPQPIQISHPPANSIPSLIESTSGKSWYDFDDDDEDDEGDDDDGSSSSSSGNNSGGDDMTSLHLFIEGLKVGKDLTTISEERIQPKGGKLGELGVQIHERELNNDWHTYRRRNYEI